MIKQCCKLLRAEFPRYQARKTKDAGSEEGKGGGLRHGRGGRSRRERDGAGILRAKGKASGCRVVTCSDQRTHSGESIDGVATNDGRRFRKAVDSSGQRSDGKPGAACDVRIIGNRGRAGADVLVVRQQRGEGPGLGTVSGLDGRGNKGENVSRGIVRDGTLD